MKELIACRGEVEYRGKGEPTGSTGRSFEVGQTDQVRSVRGFVDI